jgi:hypothetical protein
MSVSPAASGPFDSLPACRSRVAAPSLPSARLHSARLQMQEHTRQVGQLGHTGPMGHTSSCISNLNRRRERARPLISDRALSVQTVIPAPHRGKDRGFHAGPVVHHLVVAEVQHSISQGSKPRIPNSIPLECCRVGVVLPTVDFDDQSVTDHHIHAHTRRKRHLNSHAQSQRTTSKPAEGLDYRFGSPVNIRQL